jgi:hypothetical protein
LAYVRHICLCFALLVVEGEKSKLRNKWTSITVIIGTLEPTDQASGADKAFKIPAIIGLCAYGLLAILEHANRPISSLTSAAPYNS